MPLGFGHSCGGAAVLLAEEARPGTFDALYCFEPVIFPVSWPGRGVRANPMSAAARRRRETFPSAEDAFVNFSVQTPVSRTSTPKCSACYVEDGFETVPPARRRRRPGRPASMPAATTRPPSTPLALSHGAFGRLGRSLPCGAGLRGADRCIRARRPRGGCRPPPGRTHRGHAGLGHFGPLAGPRSVAASVRAGVRRSRHTRVVVWSDVPFDPPRSLSPSKVTSFRDCALAFRFSAIEHLPDQPTIWTVTGHLRPSGLERLFWNHPAGQRTPAAAASSSSLAGTNCSPTPTSSPRPRRLTTADRIPVRGRGAGRPTTSASRTPTRSTRSASSSASRRESGTCGSGGSSIGST